MPVTRRTPRVWVQHRVAIGRKQLRQMIDELAKKYAEAVNNNDAVAVAAFYAEDGVFVTSDGPKYGREGIEKFYAALFRQFHFSNYSSKADQYSPRPV